MLCQGNGSNVSAIGANGAFATDGTMGGMAYGSSSLKQLSGVDGFNFSASLDLSIYGSSSTVQPNSIRTLFIIRY